MIVSAILLGSLIAVGDAEVTGDVLKGHWINPAQSVIVEISACGDERLCGHVRWASDKASADARAKGTDPLTGVELLHDFAPSGAGRWKGRLFVPDLRKRTRAELRLVDGRQIKIIGCAAGGLLCKSQTWRRIDPSALRPAD